MENQSNPILIVIGESGFGKSSFINLLAGEKLAPTRSKKSETTKCRQYSIRNAILGNIFIVDTPGVCDTNGVPDDYMYQQIEEHISALFLKNHSNDSIQFIAFQSLSDSRYRIKKLIGSMRAYFGDPILKSSLVLLTKKDEVQEKKIEKTQKKVKTELGKITGGSVLPLLLWTNKEKKCSTDDLRKLHQTLKNIAVYTPKCLQDLKDALKKEVEEEYKKVPKTKKVIGTKFVSEENISYKPEEVQEQQLNKVRKKMTVPQKITEITEERGWFSTTRHVSERYVNNEVEFDTYELGLGKKTVQKPHVTHKQREEACEKVENRSKEELAKARAKIEKKIKKNKKNKLTLFDKYY
jgi:GTP-binding protein EngB required for normal cell division